MKPLVFDIETTPSNSPKLIEQLRASIKPPGNIKKSESIKAWMEENADEKLAELVAKTSLDGAYGSVACIAWKFDDSRHVHTTDVSMTELEVIEAFYGAVEDSAHMTNTFCGHNIQFDLQFLKHRSIILGIKPPQLILGVMDSKPWDDRVADTMYMWTNDRNKYISLKALCWVLGIDAKDGFDGSMVADTWLIDPSKVIEYCASDVQATYEVYQKLIFRDTVF